MVNLVDGPMPDILTEQAHSSLDPLINFFWALAKYLPYNAKSDCLLPVSGLSNMNAGERQPTRHCFTFFSFPSSQQQTCQDQTKMQTAEQKWSHPPNRTAATRRIHLVSHAFLHSQVPSDQDAKKASQQTPVLESTLPRAARALTDTQSSSNKQKFFERNTAPASKASTRGAPHFP